MAERARTILPPSLSLSVSIAPRNSTPPRLQCPSRCGTRRRSLPGPRRCLPLRVKRQCPAPRRSMTVPANSPSFRAATSLLRHLLPRRQSSLQAVGPVNSSYPRCKLHKCPPSHKFRMLRQCHTPRRCRTSRCRRFHRLRFRQWLRRSYLRPRPRAKESGILPAADHCAECGVGTGHRPGALLRTETPLRRRTAWRRPPPAARSSEAPQVITRCQNCGALLRRTAEGGCPHAVLPVAPASRRLSGGRLAHPIDWQI